MNIPKLNKYDLIFPDPRKANADGIVAWGGDLNPSRVLRAYQHGIFPWYSKDDPIIWWSPDPRLIMELDDFKLSKSLRKSMKKFTYKFDTAFTQVIEACKEVPRDDQQGTWINKEIIETYTILHGMGIAHCVESYYEDKLVGGLYGVVVGSVFCGESMFSKKTDASKAAYAVLINHLKHWNYSFVDCQVPTQHLKSLGAKEIQRDEFLKKLENARFEDKEHIWKVEKNLTI